MSSETDYSSDYYAKSAEYLNTKAEDEVITADIFEYQKLNEGNVVERMWKINVDWLYEVRNEFKSGMYVFQQAIEILNHYLQKVVVDKSQLQKVALTAYSIADKNDSDVNAAHIDDLVWVCAKAYSKQEFVDCELDILEKLDYHINYVTLLDYKDYYGEVEMWDDPTFQFLLDVTAMSVDMYKYSAFVRLLSLEHFYYQMLNKPTPITSGEVFECVEVLEDSIRKLKGTKSAMIDYYNKTKFIDVAIRVFNKVS